MHKIKLVLNKVFDVVFSPFTFVAAYWFRFIQSRGIKQFKVSEGIFMKVGILPVLDHYYEPLINPTKHLRYSLQQDRSLPGIDFNTSGQLEQLKQFTFADELLSFPIEDPKKGTASFFYDNNWFDRGDSEILYSMIRTHKPRRIIEIGSGSSTLMALQAIEKNKLEDPSYQCELTCVEPYEQPWMEKHNIKVHRKRVEELDPLMFEVLEANDILFIDSSHVIRPQGDVLFEFLELLPRLKSGVLVHVHDIFLPKDYPETWLIKEHKFWNEQYVLEAFLTLNKEFKIVAALNYLFHHHQEALYKACPLLAKKCTLEPRSFWMRRS
jgi:predicted O-methyltransferase YrrM